MRTFVELLAAEGVPMAVASGSSPEAIGTILAGTGLDAYLRTVVSAEEVTRGKPAPDVFLEAARKLGADPADCVVVEDAGSGRRRRARGRNALHRRPVRRRSGRRSRVRHRRSAGAGRPGGVHGTGRARLARGHPPAPLSKAPM